MPEHKKEKWTKEMYEYLAWCLFERVYGAAEWCEEEDQRIKKYAKEARERLDDFSRKVVDNRAIRLSNEYEEHISYSFEKMHWHDIHDYDDYDDQFLRPPIEYDSRWYQIWSDAVRKRITVRMVYDSLSSGQSERLVDPYQTNAPYGKGFCHKTKQIRTFRFDRIIDITVTDQIFNKPKNWQELVKQQEQDSLDQELRKIKPNP